MANKERQRISRKIASIERRQAKITEIETLAAWIRENLSDESIPFSLIKSRVVRLHRIAKEVGLELDSEFTHEVKNLNEVDLFIAETSLKLTRWVKIGEQRIDQTEPQPKPHLCIRCNKREVHFDDYCKRCADELGIRPTGKV